MSNLSLLFIPSLFCNQFKGIQRIKHFFMYAGNFFLFCGFLALCTLYFVQHKPSIVAQNSIRSQKNFQRFFVALRFLLLLPPLLLLLLLTSKWPFSCLVLLDCFPFNFNFYCNFLPSFFHSLLPNSFPLYPSAVHWSCCCCCCRCVCI